MELNCDKIGGKLEAMLLLHQKRKLGRARWNMVAYASKTQAKPMLFHPVLLNVASGDKASILAAASAR